MGLVDFYLGEMLFHKLFHETYILHDIHSHLLQPFGAIGISGGRRCISEDRAIAKLSGLKERVKFFPDAIIGYDCVGSHDTGDIERLARCHESHAAGSGGIRYGGERVMRVLRIGHFRMNLIGDNQNIVLGANIGQADQGFLFPDDPTRIVRVAEDQYLAFIIYNRFKMIKIHLIDAVYHL